MPAQIKDKQRIRKFGEVFTPDWLVSDMVDLVEPAISKPETRVLEPSCGDGNFLVEILKRKLANCKYDYERLRAVGSLYAVELLSDNVARCHERLMEIMPENLQMQIKSCLNSNILVGDFLNGQDKIWFLKEQGMAKEKQFDYEKVIQIDQDNLDQEWRKQAEYVYKCMEALAEARKELDKAKENYDLIVAEVDRYYRESSDKKPTEKALEGLVLLDPRVQEASKDVIDAKYNVNMLEAARAGLENKRESLVNLVKLHGMGYFAEPDADIQERGELEEMRQKAVREKVRKSLHKWDKDSEIKRTK